MRRGDLGVGTPIAAMSPVIKLLWYSFIHSIVHIVRGGSGTSQMGGHNSGWGRRQGGAQYAAELRILRVYFAAELRILLVYLSKSLGRLGQMGH